MTEILNKINQWSEVWSLVIPLAIILFFRPADRSIRYLKVYLYIALALNLIATVLYVYHHSMPPLLRNNNIYYNLHSFSRVVLLSLFMLTIHPHMSRVYKPVLMTYLGLVLINFIFFESPLYISSRLFAAEGITLMLFCVVFFLGAIQDDSNINWMKQPSFLIWTGVGLYEAITIFIFLFFYPLYLSDRAFGELTMTIRKLAYTIFCILLAIALYISSRSKTNSRVEYNS